MCSKKKKEKKEKKAKKEKNAYRAPLSRSFGWRV
jgi:hypothetical protein